VNLIFHSPGERHYLLGIFSLDGERSNTFSIQQKSQRDLGKKQLELSKLLKSFSPLHFSVGDSGLSKAYNRSSSDQNFFDPSSIANWAIYRDFRDKTVP